MNAVYKKINQTQLDNNLNLIANKLKEHTNIPNNKLTFPEDFSFSINNSYRSIDWLNKNKPSGKIIYEGTNISDYFLYQRTGITSFSAPNVTKVGQYCLYGCTNLNSIYLPNVTTLDYWCFAQNACKYLVFPKCNNIGGQYPFHYTPNLIGVDFGGEANKSSILKGYYLSNYNTQDKRKLTTFIFRSHTLWTLENISAFNYTRFIEGERGGIIYVPQSLIEEYKNATNWSTILSYTKSDGTLQNQILPIEGSIYETQYIDGTPISTE